MDHEAFVLQQIAAQLGEEDEDGDYDNDDDDDGDDSDGDGEDSLIKDLMTELVEHVY